MRPTPNADQCTAGRQGITHRRHRLAGGRGAVADAETELEQRGRIDEAFGHQLPGELDVAELEHLDLGANLAAAEFLRHVAQVAGRGAVKGLIEIQRAAVEAADFRQQLADVRHALGGTYEIRAGAESKRRRVGPEENVSAHAPGEVDDDVVVPVADELDALAVECAIAAGSAGRRIANVQMHDGGARRMRSERGGRNLLRRDGNVRALSHRVTRAGDGAGDEYRIADHGCLKARCTMPASITPMPVWQALGRSRRRCHSEA